jgi:hypothetical protein
MKGMTHGIDVVVLRQTCVVRWHTFQILLAVPCRGRQLHEPSTFQHKRLVRVVRETDECCEGRHCGLY